MSAPTPPEAFRPSDLADLISDPQSYEAVKDQVLANGQHIPTYVDADGVIWHGLLEYRACLELGKTPWVVQVDNGPAVAIATLLQRKPSALDQAKIFRWVIDHHLPSVANFATAGGRENERLSTYLRDVLGVSYQSSASHIASARRLEDVTPAEAEEIRAMGADATVHRAVQALRRIRRHEFVDQENSDTVPSQERTDLVMREADRMTSALRGVVEVPTVLRSRLLRLAADITAVLAKSEQVPVPAEMSENAGTTFTPWPHQTDMCTATLAAIAAGIRSISLVAPTGAGKTALANLVVAELLPMAPMLFGIATSDVRVVWLCMTVEQEVQARRFHAAHPIIPAENLIILSVFSAEIPPAHILIMDENHHDAMATALGVNARRKPLVLIGLTATHFRGDRNGLAFERIIRAPQISALIAAGVLAPFDHYTIDTYDPEVVSNIYMEDPDRFGPTAMFFRTLEEADSAVYHLRKSGITAETVSATSPRATQIARFARGDVAVLTSVGVLAEGFDARSLRTVFVRDASRGPVMQMCGRALRRDGDKVAIILQSRNTKFSFVSEAAPRTRYVMTPSGWEQVNHQAAPSNIPQLMAQRQAAAVISMPAFITRRLR